MGNISFNPMKTTGINSGFRVSTRGYVQGTFLDDPAMRYQLEGGAVGADNLLWGGLPVTLAVPSVIGSNELGPTLVIAASLGGINGWTFFNQASAGIITPSSNVPLYAAGMSINFARPGSLLRIALPVDPTVIDSLEAAAPTVDLYWDPTNLFVTTSDSSTYGPLPVALECLDNASKTVDYDSGTGFATWVDTGSVVVVRI